jgi:hypothetical protein
VIANMASGIEPLRDLIEAINTQASDGHKIGWKS